MSVLGRVLFSSAQRIDLPDLLSIESYVATDFKYLVQSLIGDERPYIIKGFDVISPADAIGAQNVSIRVADSVVFFPMSTAGAFYYGLPAGSTTSDPLIPELKKNATNYIYLTFDTFDTAQDTRAFWDPDKESGSGGEFTQDVNTESVLRVNVNVSTSSFPTDTIPVCKVVVGATVIQSIQDCRDLLFRLGTGGASPNASADYAFKSLPSAGFERTETPGIITSNSGNNPFQSADKNIYSLKEWMDVVMTKIKEIGGTTYWYEDASSFNASTLFSDLSAKNIKSKGKWQHDSSTAGLLTWTETIELQSTNDNRNIFIRSGNRTLANNQVLYIDQQRNLPINSFGAPVIWTAGANYVDGDVGYFENLARGDWVRPESASNSYYYRIIDFYNNVGLGGGGGATPANAKSIQIDGTSAFDAELLTIYTKGVYTASELGLSDRSDPALPGLGGNFYWLALRSDTINKVSSAVASSVSGSVTEADGSSAKVVCGSAHGLVDGDYLTIVSGVYAGTYRVEVESPTIFYIQTTVTTLTSVVGYYAILTTANRTDAGTSFLLESANHGFESGQYIAVSGTSQYNGTFRINVRNDTQFNIPMSAVPASETPVSATATLNKISIRTEAGVGRVIRGETRTVGSPETEGMMTFIGMSSPDQTAPEYVTPSGYGTKEGQSNYNSDPADSLTARAAKLTSMMASRSQDRETIMGTSYVDYIVNTTNGLNQDITFTAPITKTAQILIEMAGGTSGTITLSGTLSLAANKVAYFLVDRNDPFTIANLSGLTIVDIDKLPVADNVRIFAYRLTDTNVYIWDGREVRLGTNCWSPTAIIQNIQDRNLNLIGGDLWTWNFAASQLSWAVDAYVQFEGVADTRNTVAALSGPLTMADGDAAWVSLNRTAGAATNLAITVEPISSVVATPDKYIIAHRLGSVMYVGRTLRLAAGEANYIGSGGGGSVPYARLIDLNQTTLPTGISPVIDGVTVLENDLVLFANAALNGIYKATNVLTSVTWTKQGAFGPGIDTPIAGKSTCQIENGTVYFSTSWLYDDTQAWKLTEVSTLEGEPTGFIDRTQLTISFTDVSPARTITLTPTGSYFDFIIKGKPFRKSTVSYPIPAAAGLYFIYFDSTGTLTHATSFSVPLLSDNCYVANVFWDGTSASVLGYELHGSTMDWATHSYLHSTVGTVYESGLDIGYSALPIGAPTDDTTSKVWLNGGKIRDEDLTLTFVNGTTGANPFEQTLGSDLTTSPGYLPILYRNGTSAWSKTAATAFPFAFNGANGFPQYNLNTLGSYSLSDPADNTTVVYFILATNDPREPIVAIPDQTTYANTATAAATASIYNIAWGTIPYQEAKPLYMVIMDVSSTYTSATHLCKITQIKDLRVVAGNPANAFSPTAHSSLSGLPADDHVQYALLAGRAGGQTLKGGSAASENLTLSSTANATKGKINVGLSAYDETNDRLGLKTTVPNETLDIAGSFALRQTNDASNGYIDALATPQLGSIRLTGTLPVLRGIANGSDGKVITVVNATASVVIVNDQDSNPVAANRIVTGINKPITMQAGASITLQYDATSQRWRVTGGAGSGGGDTTELLTRMEIELDNSTNKIMSPYVFKTSGITGLDGASTGTLDNVNDAYSMNLGQQMVSAQLIDAEEQALMTGVIYQGDLRAYWNPLGIDTAATYEMALDGSAVSPTWQALSMSRVGTSDEYLGQVLFAPATASISSIGTPTSTVLMTATSTTQIFAQQFTTTAVSVFKQLSMQISVAGTLSGNMQLALWTDSASLPGAQIVLSQNIALSGLSAGAQTVSAAITDTVLQPGNYWIVATTDADYKAGTIGLSIQTAASGPTPAAQSSDLGVSWSVVAGQSLCYAASGYVVDMRVRITSSAAARKLAGFSAMWGPNNVPTIQKLEQQVFEFAGSLNQYQFQVTNFVPNYRNLKIYQLGSPDKVWTGYDVTVNGQWVTFENGTFDAPGVTFRLLFDQTQGAMIDTSDANAGNIAAQTVRLDSIGTVIDQFKIVDLRSTIAPISAIVNRAPITDLASDLSVNMGVNRIMTQSVYQIQNEFGANGETVLGVLNDTLGQIRFVGGWYNNNSTLGAGIIAMPNLTDYVEITFYGTGLNLLNQYSGALNIVASVDGGLEGSNLFPASIATSVTTGRNYSANIIIPVCSGLTAGIHTVKIRNNTASREIVIGGFEILNEASTIKVNPGSYLVNGKRVQLSAQQTIAYGSSFESGVLGTRGGHVLTYLKSDGTIGKAVQPTDGAAAYLASANHANEEMTRQHHPREFGAGRSDDFSTLTSVMSSRAFTLDDGTTSLVAQSAYYNDRLATGFEHLSTNAGTDALYFTFVGTGLDVEVLAGSTSSTLAVTIDGTSVGSYTFSAALVKTIRKIASGLPYGTHVIKFLWTTSAVAFTKFFVYAPKRPTLPSGAVELAEYHVLADYAITPAAGPGSVGTGVLRKQAEREFAYYGTFAGLSIDISFDSGYDGDSSTGASYREYTFFGTGFELREFFSNGTATNHTITVDGSSNLSAYSTVGDKYGFNGTLAWTPSAGTIIGTPSANQYGAGVKVNGLTLGKHTVRVTINSGRMFLQALDIITPIHCPRSNLVADLQNTLPVGSQGIGDLRKLTNDASKQKAWVQVQGVTMNPTTSSTSYIPCPELSATVKTGNSTLDVSYAVCGSTSAVGTYAEFLVYVDGTPMGQAKECQSNVAGNNWNAFDRLLVPVSAGTHKLDVYYRTTSAATITLTYANRNLVAREI